MFSSKFTTRPAEHPTAKVIGKPTAPPPICYTMELSHSLTLNEEAYKKIPDQQKPVFLFEWLRYLDKVLVVAQKVSDLPWLIQ